MSFGLTPAVDYAATRRWSLPLTGLDQTPALRTAWSFSQNRLFEISSRLEQATLPSEIVTVGIAGSLARMEATTQSDCDLVVVLDESLDPQSPAARDAFLSVWHALADLDLQPPETTGIYAGPVSRAGLLNPSTIGLVSEDQRDFGSRILFLLELQPVWNPAGFRELSRAIVERYADRYVALDSTKEWTYLLNDLVRYFKSLCQTYLYAELFDHRRWRVRNLKARHSRLMMYVGLLFLLGEASRVHEDKPRWLAERLTWTPLERLAACYETYQDSQWSMVVACLDRFVQAMGDPDFRQQLALTEFPEAPLAREANPAYQQLKQNADDLLAELLRFALARRDAWSTRFFEYWLF